MSKTTTLFVPIIVLLAVFILGAGFGIFYQAQQALKGNENQITPQIIQQLHSKVIRAVSASGKVTNTNTLLKTITLTNAGENLTVKVGNGVQIFSYTPASAAKNGTTIPAVQKRVAFSDIKAGDDVTLSLKVLSDNSFECTSIFIIAPIVANVK